MNPVSVMSRFALGVCALALGVFVAGAKPANAAEFLVNGSFEDGDFTGWTQSANLVFTSVVAGTAQHGNYYVSEGQVDSEGFLSQSFSDVAGSTLTISGWVEGSGYSFSQIKFYFNNVPVVTIGDPVPVMGWTQYTATVTATGSDTFAVGFRNEASFDNLDNFSVTLAPIPEPETYAMMLAGLGLLAWVGRRRKQNEAT